MSDYFGNTNPFAKRFLEDEFKPIHVEAAVKTTPIPVKELEDWYHDLNDLAIDLDNSGGNTRLVDDLRDRVYKYLR